MRGWLAAIAALREVVLPARLTLVDKALSAALDEPLGRLLLELPHVLVEEELERLLPPQLLPEELREELNEDDEERPPEKPPPELRARVSLAGTSSARERSSVMRK